jgi:alkylhydroperoxidase family enzyme
MTEDEQLLAQGRADDLEHWNGEIPVALLRRLGEVPAVGTAMLDLGAALRRSASGRTLESVALRVSARRNCLYTWSGHCRIALGRTEAPLNRDEIARIAFGPAAFDGPDRLVLEAVDELLADRRLTKRTRRAIGDRELILAIATSFYDTLATIMRGVEPDALAITGLETPCVAAHSVGE